MNKTYYNEKLETLPENLRYSVMMSDWKNSLVKIQTQFRLHIDQTQVLEDNVMKLMFGDIDAPDFINSLFNDAHINSETAADILLEVDLKILKNIRERLEAIEVADEKAEEIEALLLDDDERIAKEESEAYTSYYDQAAKIRQETEEELLKEGILEDGSNITDEMLGITQEIPTDVEKEKGDLLNEINEPTKSFKPAFSQPVTEADPIPVDHQIENTHLEKPYHEEEIIPKTEPIVAPEPVKEALATPSPKPEEPTQPTNEIKKPITVNLNDIYREPIE